jgi:hypothetical protein
MAPRSQAGGSLLTNEPVNWTSTTASNFVTVPTTGATGAATLITTTDTQTLSNKSISGPVTDTNSTNRLILNPTAKTIVDGSATALFSVAVPALSGVGGAGFFLVRASDGTEFQADAGMFTYSAEAKTTTVVGAITYVAANEAKSVSSGTLTLAFTADVSVANVVTYKLQPTGSLTETLYTIEYTLFPVRGAVTLL